MSRPVTRRRTHPGTIARINAGMHPCWDRENHALYVFVYDTGVTIVAEADRPRLIGVNMRGKTDIRGVPLRDRIVERPLAGGSGWQDSAWMVPAQNGTYEKSAFFRLVEGTDGEQYIVVSGMYTPLPPGPVLPGDAWVHLPESMCGFL